MQETALWIPRGAFCPLEGGGPDTLAQTHWHQSYTGITLNVEKCELSKRKMHFLRHIISAEGISPDPAKTAAIRNMTEPSNVSELRGFL